ncbi:amino acid ABC transporter ATP-binding protein [Roseomonas frigidaquae]|uniref:Amino acid ABC transporter ATP-binding protein n=1 Tax=Falsiroseomonas frigidaquae TaxID=487318 RepID=A0ABX1F2S1_9PROT|nr:amino acid ABC transporter ATP-binding protein [Falsiroseomonas frigidaquae]NKE46630.1 amino acid ABC transporter ATP-binding protein [Falsiroseomonas frigidaquae]
MAFLALDGLCASYGGAKDVLSDVTLNFAKGEVVGLIGPSGSGKSSLLRALVGLLKPRAGQVTLGGEAVDYGSRQSLRAARDRFAIVFQQYNLFQNMTALRNVAIAPTLVKKRKAAEVEAEARSLLTKVGLGEKFNAYPDELSGGQQQRVAIARALALHPDILLLDEVTSALDPELVGEVLDTIRALHAEGITMLIVSHEMAFIREVATTVVFMDQGRVVEVGPPAQIFDAPQSPRLRDFTARILRH